MYQKNKICSENVVYAVYLIVILIITVILAFEIWNRDVSFPNTIIWKTGKFIGDVESQNQEVITIEDEKINGTLIRLKQLEELEKIPANEQYNSLGFKDIEWTIKKNPNTYRIVALGDSMTHGLNVDNEDTWPKQLERKLNGLNLSTRFEVFNTGHGSLGTYQEVEIFKNIGLNYSPDMVILQYYDSDWMSPKLEGDAIKLYEKYKKGESEVSTLVNEIKKFNFSERIISTLIYQTVLDEYVNSVDWKQEWKKYVEVPLIEMINITEEKNITLLVITWDVANGEEKNILSQLLSEYMIPFYDFSKYFPRDRSINLPYVPPFKCPSSTRLPDCHLSPLAYEIVANKTLEIINELMVK